MESITQGYNRKCKDSIAGVSDVWLFPYVKYGRTEIVTNGVFLETIPETIIYRFNPLTVNFSEAHSEEAGGKFYSQDLTLTFPVAEDIPNLEKLTNLDFGAIIKDRNGNYRVLGLFNGLQCQGISYNTGNAKVDLNGFNLSFDGREKYAAYFVEDLEDAGFFDVATAFRITQAGELRITENNEIRITE